MWTAIATLLQLEAQRLLDCPKSVSTDRQFCGFRLAVHYLISVLTIRDYADCPTPLGYALLHVVTITSPSPFPWSVIRMSEASLEHWVASEGEDVGTAILTAALTSWADPATATVVSVDAGKARGHCTVTASWLPPRTVRNARPLVVVAERAAAVLHTTPVCSILTYLPVLTGIGRDRGIKSSTPRSKRLRGLGPSLHLKPATEEGGSV